MRGDYVAYKRQFLQLARHMRAEDYQLKTWFMRGLHFSIKQKSNPSPDVIFQSLLTKVDDTVEYMSTIKYEP
jgi:hypothetical protein